jgi:3-hydroxyacyl-CoA dehydrogenase/enoyl-CoA hydratase/3-hydroxybutyryl-CoA epimerase
MTDFTMRIDDEGVAVITWDVPGRSMNVLTLEGRDALSALVDTALGDSAVKGIVLTSGKESFAGGMDLNVLAGLSAGNGNPAAGIFAFLAEAHGLLRRLERAGMDPKTLKGGKPVAAALTGTALGIGLELPLACHRIFAADRPGAKIGLPEIKVGLFPGGGGTTRLVRKLGAMAAAPFLLEGKTLPPQKAKAAGLVDEVVPPDELLARARAWVLAASEDELVKPWDRKGYKMPGGAPYHPSGFPTFVGASAMVNGRTQGVYPAAQALLSAVYEGALVDFDTALRIEARWFTRVLCEPTAAAMIRTVFVNKEALEKGARRPAVAAQNVRRLGVLGAGMMGAGIAQVAAQAGIEVLLLDRNAEAAEAGRDSLAQRLATSVSRGRLAASERDAALARIAVGADYAALAGCDLVIEAVFEDPALKAEVTARAEAAAGDGAIFATNTSTLPISELARASARTEDFIGIHFFSPVDRMMLVEIIRGPQTGERAVAKALDFVRQLRKTPIVVNDARFFYANRCIIPYLNEGIRMVAQGVAPALVENAARLVGMPVGPLQLVDETSISLGAKIARATRAAMGADYPDGAVDDVLFWLEGIGREGRRAGGGLYAYDGNGTRLGLWEGLAARYPRAPEQPSAEEVQHRLLLVQALEAVRAFEAGVLTDIREGDVGAILGWGFAPWSGGPFAWIDRIGPDRAVARAEALAIAQGPRFEPPALLRTLAAEGDGFYRRFGEGTSAAA